MAIMSLEALRRRNVAGPLLLLNLVLYVLMMGFASWALNSFVNGRSQQYYPPGPCMLNRSLMIHPVSACDTSNSSHGILADGCYTERA